MTTLQDDLLSIPGVEGADIEGSDSAPEGLRIRIAEGADQTAVGGAIRDVLSNHGLGTDTQLPGESPAVTQKSAEVDSASSPGGGEARTVIDLTDDGPDAAEVTTPEDAAAVAVVSRAPAPDDGETLHADDPSVASQSGEYPPFLLPRQESQASETSSDDATESSLVARIEKVVVEEGRTGIVVTVVASDAREATRAATSTEGGVELAVVKATAELVDASGPDPVVVDIEDRRVEGVDIVLIVLDVNGKIETGSAVVVAGRAFALGRATWAALAL